MTAKVSIAFTGASILSELILLWHAPLKCTSSSLILRDLSWVGRVLHKVRNWQRWITLFVNLHIDYKCMTSDCLLYHLYAVVWGNGLENKAGAWCQDSLTFILTNVSKMDKSFCAYGSLDDLGSCLKILACSHSEVDTTQTVTTSCQISRLGSSMVVKTAKMSQLTWWAPDIRKNTEHCGSLYDLAQHEVTG